VTWDDAAVESWDEIDDMIVQRKILSALQGIRAVQGCDLQTAIDEFVQRLDRLWETRPDDFTVSREQYGHGVYT
jgi:hypothetical protein